MNVQIIPIHEAYGLDYYVYVGDKLIRVCPSEDMANEVAAAYRRGGSTMPKWKPFGDKRRGGKLAHRHAQRGQSLNRKWKAKHGG